MTLHIENRPKTFDQVVGQNHITGNLKKIVERQRMVMSDTGVMPSGAYLFSGPSGTGKTTLARICAEQLGCNTPMEIDAATNTGVDAMREVAMRAKYAPMTGGSTAVIVDECHRLSKQAWDSMLKDIEEPPPGVSWFLCTTEPTKVPKTITTRCLAYTTKSLSERKLCEILALAAEKLKVIPDKYVIPMCAAEAGGSPRQALVNFEKVLECENENQARAALDRTEAAKESVDLARALMKKEPLPKVMEIIKEIKDSDPESVRLAVFHYFLAVCLNRPSANHTMILSNFEKPCLPSNKIGDIYLRVMRVYFKWGMVK